MSQFTASRLIDAPAETVFDTVAHIENFQKALPHITDVEFLTEARRGVGTTFRETRLMNGRSAQTELEVTEYVPNERVRLVADAGGTVWDTVFTVTPQGDMTDLTMVMNAEPYKVMAKLGNALISRAVAKAVENDLDAVKQYCEAGT